MRQIIELNSTFQSEVVEILKLHQLPINDIDLNKQFFVGYPCPWSVSSQTSSSIGDFPVCGDIEPEMHLIGIGALEIYKPNALLRSMAVLNNDQNKGIGTSILSYLIALAKRQRVKSLYLLTETAESFFAWHKFIRTDRSNVPESILNNAEFSHLCPDSAVCMTLNIIE